MIMIRRYNNHKNSFSKERNANSTRLSKFIWEYNEQYAEELAVYFKKRGFL